MKNRVQFIFTDMMFEQPTRCWSVPQFKRNIQPAVSKHVKILSDAGFISIQDVGRERYCTLKQDGFQELQDGINYFDKFWIKKLKKLEAVLNKKSK